MTTRPSLRYLWKVFFATVGLADVIYVALLFQRGSDGENVTLNSEGFCNADTADQKMGNATNQQFENDSFRWATITVGGTTFDWVGPFFCSMCLIEALVRAVEARKAALDNRELDRLEKSLLEATKTSRLKLSQLFGGKWENNNDNTRDVAKTSRFLRAWVPAIATIAFWLFILPTEFADFRVSCGNKLTDSAVATRWLALASISAFQFISDCQNWFGSIFWERLMPYKLHKAPKRFIQRLQEILRLIRFARFAGPLIRMFLKLQDQLRAMYQTRKQTVTTDTQRQLRISRPSMLFYDIQKLESLAKVQTALAKIPSSVVLLSSDLSSSVIENYNKKRKTAKKFMMRLAKLQREYLGDHSAIKAADLYDQVLKMTQDITISLSSEKRMFVHRYLMSPRALLSSRRYLISPRTRFSLSWRLTVTNCLLLEILRLCASWRLSRSFSISLSQVVARLLVKCNPPEKTRKRLAFITDHINNLRRHVFEVLPFLGQTHVDVAVCIPSGPQASLVLGVGKMIEIFVDSVAFVDIFVWFATGDIEANTHAVVPKPFFSRCILPGTLVQVLDHPTVPNLIPNILKSILATSSLVGWSRCVRWVLALVPALKIVVFDPLVRFFFSHIEEDEGLMHYAESVGILTPERKAGGQSKANLSHSDRSTFGTRNSDVFNTSQVGLSLFDDDIQSPAPTRNILTHETMPIQFTQKPMIPMQRSSSKARKSVHFGEQFQDVQDVDNDGDFSLTYS